MAGDWLPLRLDLHDDPAVYRVAKALNIDPDAVVGKLTRVWSWFNVHTTDGTAAGMTMEWLDVKVGCPGFGAALVAVGWLVADDTGLSIPRWERWNGGGAKARLQTSRRKQNQRAREEENQHLVTDEPTAVPRAPDAVTLPSRSERDKSVTTVQYRTGEKRQTPPPAPARSPHPNGVVVVEHPPSPNGKMVFVTREKRHTAPPPRLTAQSPPPTPEKSAEADGVELLRDAGVMHHRDRLAAQHTPETIRAVVAHVRTLKRPPDKVPGLIVTCLDKGMGPEILAKAQAVEAARVERTTGAGFNTESAAARAQVERENIAAEKAAHPIHAWVNDPANAAAVETYLAEYRAGEGWFTRRPDSEVVKSGFFIDWLQRNHAERMGAAA